ncbi:hypothetical protein HN51_052496, partial [Arachis hypogaea]
EVGARLVSIGRTQELEKKQLAARVKELEMQLSFLGLPDSQSAALSPIPPPSPSCPFPRSGTLSRGKPIHHLKDQISSLQPSDRTMCQGMRTLLRFRWSLDSL